MSASILPIPLTKSEGLINLSGMPNVSGALRGWASNINLIKLTVVIIDFDEEVTATEDISFNGVIQPLKPKETKYSEDGQRAWEWLQIHSFSGELNLLTNDRIVVKDIIYKVMGIFDYTRNGYIEYQIVKDYQ